MIVNTVSLETVRLYARMPVDCSRPRSSSPSVIPAGRQGDRLRSSNPLQSGALPILSYIIIYHSNHLVSHRISIPVSVLYRHSITITPILILGTGQIQQLPHPLLKLLCGYLPGFDHAREAGSGSSGLVLSTAYRLESTD